VGGLLARFYAFVDIREVGLEPKSTSFVCWRGDAAFEAQVGCNVGITGRGLGKILGRVRERTTTRCGEKCGQQRGFKGRVAVGFFVVVVDANTVLRRPGTPVTGRISLEYLWRETESF
jgi:hypothetical protein